MHHNQMTSCAMAGRLPLANVTFEFMAMTLVVHVYNR
jgi:hypothetical protein